MLAFDDGALARLAIGAGRVPYGDRARWLREIAARLAAGMSQRQAGEVLGVDQATVHRDANASKQPPEPAEHSGANGSGDANASAASVEPQRARDDADPAAAERAADAAQPSAAARRMKKCRARQSNGQILLRLTVDELDIVHALTMSGALAPADADDRRKVEGAVERLLADWSQAWAERA